MNREGLKRMEASRNERGESKAVAFNGLQLFATVIH